MFNNERDADKLPDWFLDPDSEKKRKGVVDPIIDVDGTRDIVEEYRLTAKVQGGILDFLPTGGQRDAIILGGGEVPDEHHEKLENGAPIKKEP